VLLRKSLLSSGPCIPSTMMFRHNFDRSGQNCGRI
jgi:hypothetical protein